MENRAFLSHGRQALAQPITRYMETTTTKKKLGIKVGESVTHSAEIFFTTLDKQRIKVNRNMPDDVFKLFVTGSRVYVEYLPESPGTARFVGHSASPFMSASLALIAAGLTVIFWRRM